MLSVSCARRSITHAVAEFHVSSYFRLHSRLPVGIPLLLPKQPMLLDFRCILAMRFLLLHRERAMGMSNKQCFVIVARRERKCFHFTI